MTDPIKLATFLPLHLLQTRICWLLHNKCTFAVQNKFTTFLRRCQICVALGQPVMTHFVNYYIIYIIDIEWKLAPRLVQIEIFSVQSKTHNSKHVFAYNVNTNCVRTVEIHRANLYPEPLTVGLLIKRI